MRSIPLAGCLLGLLVLAPPTLAAAGTAEAVLAPGPTPAVATDPTPAPAAAEPATALCAAEPEALSGGFLPWCGDPCSQPSAEDFCVGYDCGGVLRIDSCTCVQSRWRCEWQTSCPRW